MNLQDEIKLCFDAHIAVINIVSSEEARVLQEVKELSQKRGWPNGEGLYTWDIADQFVCIKPSQPPFEDKREVNADTILRIIRDFPGGATFILKDFHQIWESRRGTIRGLRNLAASLPEKSPRKNIIITTPEYCLPLELKADIPVLDLPKPTVPEIDVILERSVGATGALNRLQASLRAKLVEAALGLTSTQAIRVFQKAVIRGAGGNIDEGCIDLINQEKRAIVRESGALELYPYVEALERVGGLEILKTWLEQRRMAFTDEAREYGLELPRGVALLGIPGTGKSLCAKMTAGLWKMPLLRLDMGAVFGGLLGASEKNIREAIQIAEVIAPCVLWVDEIEKAFSGSTGDSGTAKRVLATFLTWMQEKHAPVFVLATANDVERLPPEFLRKGRFDEVFFLDLPTPIEREQILIVHLRRKGLTMVQQRFNLAQVVEATESFVGSELEAVVNDSLFPAFMDGRREIETADLIRAANEMVPLAISRREHIERLRQVVINGEARSASRQPSKHANHVR
ncbi:ATPase [Achromatium sp. WMS2]|nr:ATPase [Achromatium sp. WMS2]